MYLTKFGSKLFGVLLAVSVFSAVGFFSPTHVQAQGVWRQRDRDRDWERERHNRRDRDDRDDNWDRERGNGRFGRGRLGRYGQRGNSGYYGYNIYQVAQQRGYQDGLNTGANDARRGQSYNPQRSHYYQNATYGYDSSYGNRNEYKQVYRQGFLQGYRQGFQQYGGYYGNGTYNRRWPW